MLDLSGLEPDFQNKLDRIQSEFDFIPNQVYDVQVANKQMSYKFDANFSATEIQFISKIHSVFLFNFFLLESEIKRAQKLGETCLKQPIFTFLELLISEDFECSLKYLQILKIIKKSKNRTFSTSNNQRANPFRPSKCRSIWPISKKHFSKSTNRE